MTVQRLEDLEAEVKLLSPQPGDIIVVRTREKLTPMVADALKDHLASLVRDKDVKYAICDWDADLELVRGAGDGPNNA